MTEIADVVQVTVNVADTRVTQAGFGTPLIFDLIAAAVFPERVREYPNLAAVVIDFAETTKVYKAANALFAQSRAPQKVKVGRRDVGDANHTTALNAIESEDTDWYMLVTSYKSSADINELDIWISTRSKIFLASSEDVDVLTNVDTDVLSLLKAKTSDRTSYMWSHQAGVDVTGAGYTIASGVINVNKVAHGLQVGDPVTFLNSSGISVDGNNTVASVVDADNFTCATTAADEAGPDTVDYFARYVFPEIAWAGYMLPSDPGSETWFGKQLTGITATPKTEMNPTEEAEVLSKNGNLYTPLGGIGHTHPAVMVSNRFIDIQRGIDWLEARIGEAITNRLLNEPKIPYTDAGASIFQGDISSVLDLALTNNVLGPLLDDSGDLYRINIPKVADQLQADRTARYFPGITVEAQLAGAVQSLEITVNAQV